ncbi:hypothetical protein ASE93_23375 [Serratia sp. Leaf50]|nr:hypothetical protein ASE93_23375 [Serratia sp. Leaf50]
MKLSLTKKQSTRKDETNTAGESRSLTTTESSWELETHPTEPHSNNEGKSDNKEGGTVKREAKEFRNTVVEALLSYCLHPYLALKATPFVIGFLFTFLLNPLLISSLPAIAVSVTAFMLAALGIWVLRRLLVWAMGKIF